jgi:hypothetical protein
MIGHVEKVLDVAIARGIEQLHPTVEFVMAKILANTNLAMNDIRLTNVQETLVT